MTRQQAMRRAHYLAYQQIVRWLDLQESDECDLSDEDTRRLEKAMETLAQRHLTYAKL